jgi:transmembrane sensor
MSANITVEELAADESFQHWVNHGDEADVLHWNEWMLKNPQHAELVQQASTMVKLLQALRKKEIAHKKKDLIIADMQLRLGNQPAVIAGEEQPEKNSPPIFTFHKIKWAAILVLLVGSLVTAYLVKYPNQLEEKTTFGENRSVRLPDGSLVKLNANSKLRRGNNWNNTGIREVWLDGEAFFDIKHTLSDQRFIVHTTNGDVEVLGTTFNVYNRTDRTRVVLTTGKVKITGEKLSVPLFLSPGEMAELSTSKIARKIAVDTVLYTSWNKNVLVFDNTALKDVGVLITDNYGYKIHWSDSSLPSVKFTYKLVGNDLDVLLQTLEEALDLKIRKEGNVLTVFKK